MTEDKYYYNGVYINLDGLPIDEYMKSPCCYGGGSGGSEESTKPKNKITIVSELDEVDGKVYYKAESDEPVTTFLQITVISTTNNKTVLELYVGDKVSKREEGDTLDMLGVNINVKEDDNYVYEVHMSGNDKYVIYTKAVLRTQEEIRPIEDGFDRVEVFVNTTNEIVFTIPSSEININEFEMDELEAYIKNNQYILVVVLPKKVYMQGKYIIYNSTNADMTDKFRLMDGKSVVMDNIEYVYMYEGAIDEESMNSYVPQYGEETVYGYKLSLVK